jgi:hypothetical protein
VGVIGDVLHQPGADRVLDDVTTDRPRVFFTPDRVVEETRLPDSLTEPVRADGLHRTHDAGQGVVSELEQPVQVIRHDDERECLRTRPSGFVGECRNERSSGRKIREDGLMVACSRDDVIPAAGF